MSVRSSRLCCLCVRLVVGASVRVTFGGPWHPRRGAARFLCRGMGCAVARNQRVLGNGGAPEEPARFRLQIARGDSERSAAGRYCSKGYGTR